MTYIIFNIIHLCTRAPKLYNIIIYFKFQYDININMCAADTNQNHRGFDDATSTVVIPSAHIGITIRITLYSDDEGGKSMW